MWDANPAKPPTKLLMQARMGTIRPYVASHHVDEVRRHIPEVAARTGVDGDRVARMFEQHYLPIVWRVDVAAGTDSVLASQVVLADPSDGPIAQLAVLLGVRVVTKNKRHFKQLAIDDEWLTVVSAYASVSLLDGTNAGIAVTARVSGEGAMATGRAVKRGVDYLAGHPHVAIGVSIAAALLVIFVLVYLSDDERLHNAWEAINKVAPPAMRFAGRALQAYTELAGAAVEAEVVIIASRLPREKLTLEQRLAKYLGSARVPVPIETMVEGLSARGRRLIEDTLTSNPEFVLHERGWTLGRRCAPAA
jgi:hypothetical protein